MPVELLTYAALAERLKWPVNSFPLIFPPAGVCSMTGRSPPGSGVLS